MSRWDGLVFDERGLIPVVAQDARTGRVLMVAWANREALDATLESGELTFYSRSRGRLWRKGETSGNTLTLVELKGDCDGDTLLALVEPAGPACHTGEETCFFRSLAGADGETGLFLGRLEGILAARAASGDPGSYTARLLAAGTARVAQKVGEEGVETALATALGDRERFREEAADLLYHLLVAARSLEVPLRDVLSVLEDRHRRSPRPEIRETPPA